MENSLSTKKALFEAFFVVFGVILALAANEFREHLNRKSHAETALAGIYEEIRINREAVQSSFDYHNQLINKIREIHSSGKKTTERIFTRGFISPAPVFKTAFETAIVTNAFDYLDYSDVLNISKLYAHQERYEEQAKSVSSLIYSELFSTGTEVLMHKYENLGSIISTFLYRERQLLELYDNNMRETE